MNKQDSVNLSQFKNEYPLFKKIPDEEFRYINGKWFISSKVSKQLAFLHKNRELINFFNKVEDECRNGRTNKN